MREAGGTPGMKLNGALAACLHRPSHQGHQLSKKKVTKESFPRPRPVTGASSETFSLSPAHESPSLALTKCILIFFLLNSRLFFSPGIFDLILGKENFNLHQTDKGR